MKKTMISAAVASALLLAGTSAMANNGNGASGSPSGLASFGPIDSQINGAWLEFSFTGAGTPATGCQPADPAGGPCGSLGGSVFADAPPWTFDIPYGGGTLKVTDAFLYGDIFDVLDSAVSQGQTSFVVPTSGSCTTSPDACFADPYSSSEAFPMAAGSHSITITPTASPYGSGAAFFRVDAIGQFVDIDIKFCSDPNAFNTKKKGVLPVTIFGDADLDVWDIDIDTLRLCTDAAGTTCTTSAPKSWSVADRGEPGDAGTDECIEDVANTDGYDDLDVGFYAHEVTEMLLKEWGLLERGVEVGPLYLVGNLNDDTPIGSKGIGDVGIDKLVIKN